jgi:LuxR family quorum-sensing system transcriptional regulator CciR
MTRLADVQSFIDLSRTLQNPADLNAILREITREMGFDHFALIHHVDLTPFEAELGHMATGQLVALIDYPESWVEQYIGNNVVTYDPVLLASHRTTVGFAWSEIPKLIEMKSPHYEQLERGRRAGIGDGFTIPSNVPGEANGSCNFVVRTGRDLPTESLMMAQLVGSYAFEAARNTIMRARTLDYNGPRLSPRQIDCLFLYGRGKTVWEISQILGLTEATVQKYFDEARARYGVSSRMQVLVRAIFDGQIPLTSLLRGH